MFGYSLAGAPRGRTADFIEWANQTGTPILALDTQSGLDITTGKAQSPTIRAAATTTLVLPKLGLLKPEAAEYVGELYLADISVSPELYADAYDIHMPDLFYKNTLMRIQSPDTI